MDAIKFTLFKKSLFSFNDTDTERQVEKPDQESFVYYKSQIDILRI
jgi:hypothetical protein